MSMPIRIFEGTHQPYERFWKLKNIVNDGEPEMELYGYISEFSWFSDDITPRMFKDDLYSLGKGGPITVRMHSGGGDVYAASVIRSIMMDYPGMITIKIDGLAASAASVVAMAGDSIKMQETGFMMIHDPITLAYGNIDELRKTIDTLKVVKDGIIDAYHTKTKQDVEKIAKWMSDETWMTAKKALSLGFIDEIIATGEKNSASSLENPAIVNALLTYRNLPDGLRSLLEPGLAVNEPENPELTKAAERLRAEVKILTKGGQK
jgi:ATP-dependent Clp protease, protease subunit